MPTVNLSSSFPSSAARVWFCVTSRSYLVPSDTDHVKYSSRAEKPALLLYANLYKLKDYKLQHEFIRENPWHELEGPRELIWIDPHAKYVHSAVRPPLRGSIRTTAERHLSHSENPSFDFVPKSCRIIFFFLLIWSFVCRYFSNTSTQGRLSPSSAVWTCFDGGCQLTLTFSLFL